MVHGVQGSVEYGGKGEVQVNDVQYGRSYSDAVRKQELGDPGGNNYEDVGGFSTSDQQEARGEDDPVCWVGRLVMAPGRRRYIGSGDVDNAGICTQATGDN